MHRSVSAAATRVLVLLTALAALSIVRVDPSLDAQTTPPTVVDPNLAVREVVTGLTSPRRWPFSVRRIPRSSRRKPGRVLRVLDGVVQDVVLDLNVNFASERGLLGIALHPDFPGNPGVYLYWTESTSGADSNALAERGAARQSRRPVRVERIDAHARRRRSFGCARSRPTPGSRARQPRRRHAAVRSRRQALHLHRRRRPARVDAEPPVRSNRYVSGAIVPDDQFGGPRPDNAHLTGVVLRLNDDGSTTGGQSASGWRGVRATRRGGTSGRSSPTDCATLSAWTSTRCPAISGSSRTATTASPRSIASSRG